MHFTYLTCLRLVYGDHVWLQDARVDNPLRNYRLLLLLLLLLVKVRVGDQGGGSLLLLLLRWRQRRRRGGNSLLLVLVFVAGEFLGGIEDVDDFMGPAKTWFEVVFCCFKKQCRYICSWIWSISSSIPSPPPWIVVVAAVAVAVVVAAAVPRGSREGPTCPPWTLWRTNLLSRIQKFDWIWENKVKTNHQAGWRKQRQRKRSSLILPSPSFNTARTSVSANRQIFRTDLCQIDRHQIFYLLWAIPLSSSLLQFLLWLLLFSQAGQTESSS